MTTPTAKPTAVIRYEALERELAAAYDALPDDTTIRPWYAPSTFNTWILDAAHDAGHAHHAAAAEYCDLWQNAIVYYFPNR